MARFIVKVQFPEKYNLQPPIPRTEWNVLVPEGGARKATLIGGSANGNGNGSELTFEYDESKQAELK
jgi:hypothetical protein